MMRKCGDFMIEIKGKYNTAKVFTNNVEPEAMAQILELCNQEFVKDSVIRIMPDTHAGAGCTIGTTMTIDDKIVPNLVGVDIGCGMETIKLKNKNIELSKLDKVIHEFIPSGFDIRKKEHPKKHVDINRAKLSIGTLGGGNHFIEVNKDSEGNLYLVVHSGSRHLGKQVAEYYQELGYKELVKNTEVIKEIIAKLKAEGREKEIEKEINVQGKSYEDYLADMKLVQKFAVLNRKAF